MKNYFIIRISRVSPFISEILSKIRRGVVEKTRILLEDSILPHSNGIYHSVDLTHVYHVDKVQHRFIILINVLETCTTVSKISHNMLWMICSTFSALNLPLKFFCSNKRQIWSSASAWPNLWCSIFPHCLALHLFNWNHKISGGLVKSWMFSSLLVCSWFPEKVFIPE